MKNHLIKTAVFARQTLLLGILLCSTTWAACGIASGGDANIGVTQQGLQFGKMVAPDAGQNATITLDANGTRSIPANININPTNRTRHGDIYQVAVLNITGAADCTFRVNVGSVPSPFSNVTLQGINGTSLSSNQSGATGLLSGTGTATVQVGASVTIDTTTTTNDLDQNIPITVEFVPD